MKNLALFNCTDLQKKIFALIGGLLVASGSLSATNYSIPTPIGGPIPLNPGVTFPDPILANLDLVMDNWFQPPSYPGNYNSPTYLQGIYYLSDAYTGSRIVFNPLNDQEVFLSIGQNQPLDLTGVIWPILIGSNTLAVSQDGGTTWSYNPPPEQIIPLGGTIAQVINASTGPGLYLEFTKNGILQASGWGFFSLRPNAPNLDIINGFLFSSSEDKGVTWAPFEELWPQKYNNWFTTFIGPPSQPQLSGTASGLQEFYTTADPSNGDTIHVSSNNLSVRPVGSSPKYRFYQDVYYFRSDDGGKTFSAPVKAYTISDDPKWLTEMFNPLIGNDLEYLQSGGAALLTGHPIVFDDSTILLPVTIEVANKKSTSQARLSNHYIASGFVRSLDNGKTWSKMLGMSELKNQLSINIFDPGFINPSVPILINGYPSFGFFLEGAPGLSRNMTGLNIVSASTGRLYSVCSILQSPGQTGVFNQTRANGVRVTSSPDQGVTWSPYAKVNQTPSDIPIGAQQAYSQGAAISSDGWFVVGYYDFRNWTGYPGEMHDNIVPDEAPPLPTDAWLAVFKETEDPLGGSTGVGLDFVTEIRLTPESFNGRSACLSTAIPYITPYVTGTPEQLPLAFNNKNELYAIYSTQSFGSTDNIDTNSYKGMTVDTNGYYNLFLQRFKFPRPSNQ